MAANAVTKPASIRNKIKAAIAPWRCSNEQPPFTEVQLVVMAIMMNGGEAASVQIHKWVLETFLYYREEVAQTLWTSTKSRGTPHPEDQFDNSFAYEFHKEMNSVFQSFELPLQERLRLDKPADDDERHFIMTGSAGEGFLATVLPPPERIDPTTFSFFGLPLK